MSSRALMISIFLVALAPVASADDDIKLLERAFEEEAYVASKPIKEKYVVALKELETKLASQAKIAASQIVKAERERVEKEIAQKPKSAKSASTPKPGGSFFSSAVAGEPVVLDARSAKLSGGATYRKAASVIAKIRPGASVTWTLPDVAPGEYTAVVTASCDETNGGGDYAVKIDGTEKKVTPLRNGTWSDTREQAIGKFKLDAKSIGTIVTLTPGALAKNAKGIIHLRSITLHPGDYKPKAQTGRG